MLLIMIRHGQTDANSTGRLSGQVDSELSETGVAQAAALAQRLANDRFDHIYTSDLKRAISTATAVSSEQQVQSPTQCSWLRERHAGVLQGLTKKERKTRYPQVHAAWKSDNPDLPIEGGESRVAFEHRVTTGITALAEQHENDTIAIVAHAGVLRAMFNFVFGSQQNGNRLRCANTAICQFRHELGIWSMERWGDSAHLG